MHEYVDMFDTPFCDYVDISRQAYNELIERIEQLERRNAELERRNVELERRIVELNQQVTELLSVQNQGECIFDVVVGIRQ
jgi:cell division protein FtsB